MSGVRDKRIQRTDSLPAVGTLLNEPAYAELVGRFGRAAVVDAIREQITAERNGKSSDDGARLQLVEARLRLSLIHI